MNSAKLMDYLQNLGYVFNDVSSDNPFLEINGVRIIFDFSNEKYRIDGIRAGHERILDLTKPENHSVVMLLIKLFEKGYSKDVISLEKRWQLGHNDSGSLDVMLKNPDNNDIYMIEVKSELEIDNYINLTNEKKLKQVFSYAMQEKTTKIISFYAYSFSEDKDLFYNVYTDDILKDAQNVDDFFERWNKVFDKSDYIINNDIFNLSQNVKKYNELEAITNRDTKILFNQFSTILRLHSISDKPNAFIKMINLFLAKIGDEVSSDKIFVIKDKNGNIHSVNGVKFQYVRGLDTPESFMKRLNELYREGMKEYLNKEVIDYSDDEIMNLLADDMTDDIVKAFDDLRLKRNNNFAFLDVFDETTFQLNFEVVRDVVELLENYKFKYETKHQFLGDFFEELLNTSLKQEAGQFFTPYPIVDFMIDSLPYEEIIEGNIGSGKVNFLPSVIDYACGAGHFLISSMAKTQKIITEISKRKICLLNSEQLKKIKAYIDDPYSWVNKNNCVGIEKDYRLAKTTKIATFLNGDGDAEIISGDGINKFCSTEYANTALYSLNNKIEKFDFVISNPPYSIDGFMRNFTKNKISPENGVFSLLEKINYKDSAIETFFVERTEQLLKKGGHAAIILPQSILSNSKYENMRNFIFKNFQIKAFVMTSDITFSGTTTSPVILFLEKKKTINMHYEIAVVGSPKYMHPTGKKLKKREVDFLGYEFSTNRAKTGIALKRDSVLLRIAPILKNFIVSGKAIIPEELSNNLSIKYLDDILLNEKLDYCGDIYPKYNLPKKGKPLFEYCSINSRTMADFDIQPTEYLEIGGLAELRASGKIKKSTRLCKAGDILISSLCPKKSQIVIADKDYLLSNAIHVLSDFESEEMKNKIYEEIKSDDALVQMNALLDGFKITYAKISDTNLYNNILIDVN